MVNLLLSSESIISGSTSEKLFEVIACETTVAFPAPLMMLWYTISDTDDLLTQMSAVDLLKEVLEHCLHSATSPAVIRFISSPKVMAGLIKFSGGDGGDDGDDDNDGGCDEMLKIASLKILSTLASVFSDNENLRDNFLRALTTNFLFGSQSGEQDKLALIECLVNFCSNNDNLR